jgi:hypothetical protein
VNVGFSGTRTGMMPPQREGLRRVLSEIRRDDRDTLHHGDCLGSDSQADEIASQLGYRIEVHPPTNPRFRAYCVGPPRVVHPPKEYLVRNTDIVKSLVNARDVMILTPKEFQEHRKGGTWHSYRVAKKLGVKNIMIIQPSGLILDSYTWKEVSW